MLVTEEEAKTKWCPRESRGGTGVTNKCIGSECMVWWWIDKEKTKGYCGLARDGQE